MRFDIQYLVTILCISVLMFEFDDKKEWLKFLVASPFLYF